MKSEPVPPWIVGAVVFCVVGICCASAFLTSPAWAPLLALYAPSQPARVAPTIEPSATPTRFVEPTSTRHTGQPNEQYLLAAREELAKIALALGAMGELLDSPQLTDSWATDFANQIITIQNAHKALSAMDPPNDLQWLHNNILDGTADCNRATIKLMDQQLDQAEALINRCGEKIAPMAAQVREMLEE